MRSTEPSSKDGGTKGLALAAGLLLLVGGALLDIDRVAAAREALDKVAHVAAFEAAAASRTADRKALCQKRFAKTVWTDSEVSVDEIDVSVVPMGRGNMAVVSYDATVQLVVGRFFGVSEIEISGEAEVLAPSKQAAQITP